MENPLLYSNTADRLLSALCDTLLHSLWQGIILAAVAGLIVICTRKASSALRYNLLVSALLLFAIGVGATFAWQYEGSAVTNATILPTPHSNGYTANAQAQPMRVFVPGQQVVNPGFTAQVKDYLAGHHNTIVFIWFLIVCARSLQLAFGLYGTYRLRRVRVFAVEGNWSQCMQQLADALGIKQSITLLESGLAKVPMVIGHLKPVVLVPIGLLTALSTEEVEAILIHELAHIKRRDYLVNMLQSLVEIILFFNPAVLWVSKLIKTERENCCDDLALAQNNNKVNYIRALISCEEYQASVPAYAMGFPGGKHTLLDRVKRMASNRNHSLNTFEKTILAVCLVVLCLGVSAFTAREDIKKAVKSIVAAINHPTAAQKTKTVKSDTTKNKQTTPTNDVNALLNRLQAFHPDTITTTGNAELDALVRKVDSLNVKKSQLSGLNVNLPGFKGTDDHLSLPGKPDTNVVKTLMKNNAVGRELYREHLVTDTNHLSITTNLDKRELIVNGVRMPDDVYQRIYEKYYKKGESGSYTDNNPRFASDDKTNNIISDMMKDGIITSTDNLSFKIGTTEFVVNYKKQPEALYQKYRAKYVPKGQKGDWIWFYQFDTNKWDQMTGRKNSSDFDGTATGVFQGKEDANSGYNNSGYNNGTAGAYSASANSYSDRNAYNRLNGEEQQRLQAERDKKLVADLMQDSLITDPKNVTFTLTDKKLTINGKKQNDEVYKKYKDKYVPNNTGSNWNWTYSHHE